MCRIIWSKYHLDCCFKLSDLFLLRFLRLSNRVSSINVSSVTPIANRSQIVTCYSESWFRSENFKEESALI